MELFSAPDFDHHEQIAFCHDEASGLRAIIALHDLTLGPALGGCRMWTYESDADALTDALRLSHGMTYKAALAGLAYGGGKSVIMADPKRDKSEALFRAFGRAVESLGGRYIVAEDVGTTPADMDVIATETRHVCGCSRRSSGDPSPVTAEGLVLAIDAAVRHRLGREGVDGLTAAIQGLGHVGMPLARRLAARGASLIVSDVDPACVAEAEIELGARAVGPDEILGVEADILVPCALGGILDDDTIPRLAASIVAGPANNQLLEDRHGEALRARGVLYAPDYVANAGGLINVASELEPGGHDSRRTLARLQVIPRNLKLVFEQSDREGVATNVVADRMARQVLTTQRAA